MLADSPLFQLLLFVLAHVAAYGNMRTGRMTRGFVQFAGVWILLDFALVERFVAGETGAAYLVPLVMFQLLAVLSFLEWHLRRRLCRRPSFIAASDEKYSKALTLWMAGLDQEAVATLQPMLRRNPWDVEARLLLGCIEHENGRSNRALRLLKDAAYRTQQPRLKEEIREELRRVKAHMAGLRGEKRAKKGSGKSLPKGGKKPLRSKDPTRPKDAERKLAEAPAISLESQSKQCS
ncbi:MAG: hypothetical protein CSA62_03345 [Planctomycetota bacterium]|nr:MAG: hypothetical protein CSA62_03345 [Planctomycetota bacterium]